MNMESVVEVKQNPNIPEITSGDTVRVSTKIVEGDKERTQVFQGVVIRIRRRGPSSSFTVRRVAYGVGVERTFPLYSPRVEKVEIVRRGKKRRAKLYYLRGLSAKTSRLRERRLTQQEIERERERLQKLEEERELEQEPLEAQEEPAVAELEPEQVMEEEVSEEPGAEAEAESVMEEETPEAETETVTEEEEALEAEVEPEPVMEEEETQEAPEAELEKEEVPEEEAVTEPVMEQEEAPEAEVKQEVESEQEEKG